MTRPFGLALIRMTALSSLLSLGSCASTPELDLVLNNSRRGTVYLERIPDRSFQATHPITISQNTLAQVLRGFSVAEKQGLLQDLLAGQPTAVAVFSEDEILYLAPLIAEGLSRAAPDQQIGFRLDRSGTNAGPPSNGTGSSDSPIRMALAGTSKGSIYAYGRSLYFTLLEYPARSGQTNSASKPARPLPDHSGLRDQTLSFTPESARRPDSYRGKNTTSTTLVIDYEGLATLATASPAELNRFTQPQETAQPPSPSPASAAGTEGQLRLLQEQMRQKNRELEDLRKELQEIRRDLIKPSNGATAPTSKLPQSQDNR